MRQFITRIYQYKQRQTNRIVQQLYYPETEQKKVIVQSKRIKNIEELFDSYKQDNIEEWFRSMKYLHHKNIITSDFWNNKEFQKIRENIITNIDNCIIAKQYYRKMFNQLDFALEQQLLQQIIKSKKLSTLKTISVFYKDFDRFTDEQLNLLKLTIQNHYQSKSDQSAKIVVQSFLVNRSKIIAETIAPNDKNFYYLATYKLRFPLFPQNELYVGSLLQIIKENLYLLNAQQSIEILTSYLKLDQGDLPLYRGLLWNIVRYKNQLQASYLSNLCYIFLQLHNFKFKKFDLDFQSGYYDLIDTLVILSIKNRKPNQAQALIQIGRQNAISRELIQILATQLIGFKVRSETLYIATNMGAIGGSMFEYSKYIGNSLLIELEEKEIKGYLPEGKQQQTEQDNSEFVQIGQRKLESLILNIWCIIYQHYELKQDNIQLPYDILNNLIYYANKQIEQLDTFKDQEFHLSLDLMKCLSQINYYIDTQGKKMFGQKLNHDTIKSWELLRVYRKYNKRTQAYKHELMEYLIFINQYEVERYVNQNGFIFDFKYQTENGKIVFGNINGVKFVEMHMNGEEMNILKFQRELLKDQPHVEIVFNRLPNLDNNQQKLIIEESLQNMIPKQKELDEETKMLLKEMRESLIEIYGEQRKNYERSQKLEKLIQENEVQDEEDEYVLSDEEE